MFRQDRGFTQKAGQIQLFDELRTTQHRHQPVGKRRKRKLATRREPFEKARPIRNSIRLTFILLG